MLIIIIIQGLQDPNTAPNLHLQTPFAQGSTPGSQEPFRLFQVLSYRKAFSVIFPPNLCVKESTFSISHVGLSPSLCRDCPDTRSKLSTCTCCIPQFPSQQNSSKQNRKHNPRMKPGSVKNKTVTTSNILWPALAGPSLRVEQTWFHEEWVSICWPLENAVS